MSPRKKDVFVSPAYGAHQPSTDQDTCPRSGFGHSPNYDFLPKNSEYHKFSLLEVDPLNKSNFHMRLGKSEYEITRMIYLPASWVKLGVLTHTTEVVMKY